MILAVAVIGGITMLASCKKDYSCECNGVGIQFSYDTTIVDVTKKEAIQECDDLDVNIFGIGQECELK